MKTVKRYSHFHHFESIRKVKKAGATIRKRREALGLSQEGLAEGASTHRNYIGAVERGESSPSIFVLANIAEALGLKTSELLKEAGF